MQDFVELGVGRSHPSVGGRSDGTTPNVVAQRRQGPTFVGDRPEAMRDMDAWQWPAGAPSTTTTVTAARRMWRRLQVAVAPGASASAAYGGGPGAPAATAQRRRDARRGRREVAVMPRSSGLHLPPPPATAPSSGGVWCRYSTRSNVFMQASIYDGSCFVPSHPKVRMWNRFARIMSDAAAGRDTSGTLCRGRAIWDVREGVRTGSIRRPAALVWTDPPSSLTYDSRHVVYARVPVRGRRAYVGVTSVSIWARETARQQEAFDAGGRPVFTRGRHSSTTSLQRRSLMHHLHTLGPVAAMADFYYVPLEYIPPLAGEAGLAWVSRVRAYERWWIHRLDCSLIGGRGWNVQHTAAEVRHHTSTSGRRRSRARRRPMMWRRISRATSDAVSDGSAAQVVILDGDYVDGDSDEEMVSPPASPPDEETEQQAPDSIVVLDGEAVSSPGSASDVVVLDGECVQPSQRTGRTARRRARRNAARRSSRDVLGWLGAVREAWDDGAGALQRLVTSTSSRRLRLFLPELRTRAEAAGLAVTASTEALRLVLAELRTARASSGRPQSRALLVAGYVGSVLERVGLAGIVASEEVMSLLPPEMVQLSGRPMVVYRYAESVQQRLCNWGSASRGAARDGRPCACHLPQFHRFHGAGVQHVVTKDLSVIQDPVLRDLLSRGVSFRESYAHLFTSATPDRDATVEDDIEAMVGAACDRLAERQEELNGIAVDRFFPWQAELLTRLRRALGRLTTKEREEMRLSDARRTHWMQGASAALRDLHSKFVISVADKETSVATVTCRAHWEARLRQEVLPGGAYQWTGAGAQIRREGRPGDARPPTQLVTQPPPPPPLIPPVPPPTMLMVDEVTRIERATHEFGVIGDVLCREEPSSTRVARLFDESLARLARDDGRRARGLLPAMDDARRAAAERRLRVAFGAVRAPASRRILHARLWQEAQTPPVTCRQQCLVDRAALEQFAASPLGLTVCTSSDKHASHLTGRSFRQIIEAYLGRFGHRRSETVAGASVVDLEYRYSARTSALVAAGWLTGGRERAEGDPFSSLPPRELRSVALRRFGHDFDDSASFPRAACAAIPVGRALASSFLSNREDILAALGTMLLPQQGRLTGWAVYWTQRGEVKRLINSLDMDGTYGDWRRMHGHLDHSHVEFYPATWRWSSPVGPNWPGLPGSDRDDGPFLAVGNGELFPVRRYIREQPLRTRWLAEAHPHLIDLYERWASVMVPASDRVPAERTLKSDMLSEFEWISRTTKRWWADTFGHVWQSLQHDGVAMALRGDVTVQEALRQLRVVCSHALGYDQPVEQKEMSVRRWPMGPPPPAVLPAQRHAPPRLTAAAQAAANGEPEHVRVLCAHFDALQQRGMLPQQGARHGRMRAAGDESSKESALEGFLRTARLSYLYATVKTHKQPYGWRVIAGGHQVSVSPISDWLHRACASLLPDIDMMMVEAVQGLPGSHRVRGSWILRDGRGVVERIRDLEGEMRRRRHAGGAGYFAWRHVEFGVHDFTTLYTTLPHDEIRVAMRAIVNEVFLARHAGQWLRVTRLVDGGHAFEWVARAASGTLPAPNGLVRHYDAATVLRDVDFILDNIYVTLGDDVYRQVLGVPMGFSCSPMLAVIMLAYHEITFVRRLVAQAQQRSTSVNGAPTMVETPSGRVSLSPQVRTQMQELAVRVASCCRAIDDVLMIDLTSAERRWVLDRIYPASLQLTEEYASPGPIRYLDMEIKHDRGGFYTDLYDKRDVMAAAGKMDRVRKFPHVDSALSLQCKYGCITSFLHRIHRGVMRRRLFVRHAVERVAFMVEHGYDRRRLLRLVRRFMQRFYLPRPRWRATWASIQRETAVAMEDPVRRAARNSQAARERRAARSRQTSRTASPSHASRTASGSSTSSVAARID